MHSLPAKLGMVTCEQASHRQCTSIVTLQKYITSTQLITIMLLLPGSDNLQVLDAVTALAATALCIRADLEHCLPAERLFTLPLPNRLSDCMCQVTGTGQTNCNFP